jgi:phosphoribosylamine--glycine ligase
MKVLVVGSGGREHAMVWKIKQSPKVKEIFVAPGNAGTAELAQNVDIASDDIKNLLKFAQENKIDLTVVGPEVPLVAGIVDLFESHGLRIFGPNSKAAYLEGSKVFSKEIMEKYKLPTAETRAFSEMSEAKNYLEELEEKYDETHKLVVKADGLAAGKGVFVCANMDEAQEAVQQILGDEVFGEAGEEILIEECLIGEEASILAFTDGQTIIPMASSQDHKRINDNDQGLNTGGMGAYSPAPVVTDKLMSEIDQTILQPLLKGLKAEGIDYRGVIYVGVMVTKSGPKILEFNVRFGDPETQPILMRLKNDLVEVMEAVIDRKLSKIKLEWDTKPAVCVVVAAGGYPGKYEKGKPIHGLKDAAKIKDVVVFHAGTKSEKGSVVTAGGRVLGVTALGKDVKEAAGNAYETVGKINFEAMHFRKDIAARAINRK